MELIKIKKRFELSANPANAEEDNLYLYGYVTDSRYSDSAEVIATKEVREAILGSTAKVLNVHINSYGGDAADGIAISSLLKQHSAEVNVYIDGVAASSASVIAMAGKVHMPANALMMIHCAATFAWGNAAALRKEAEALEKFDEAVCASYMAKFKGTAEELKTLLEDETWLTADDAHKLGLCDVLLEAKPEEEPEDSQPKNSILKRFGIESQTAAPESPKPQINMNAAVEAFFNGFKIKPQEESRK